MKYKTTRRPGKATEPRVTQFTLIAETEAEEIRLGEMALRHNAIFLPPKFKLTEGTHAPEHS